MAATEETFTNTNDPIFRKDCPMDNTMVADILGSLIRAEPTVNPYHVPEFRLDQLYSRSCITLQSDGDVLEALGCVYTICYHYGTCSTFQPLSGRGITQVDRKCVALMQVIAVESICEMQDASGLYFLDPKLRHEQLKGAQQYLEFTESLEIAQSIIRDLMEQVRLCRQQVDTRTQKYRNTVSKFRKDCTKPHCLFFMAMFGLNHIGAILQRIDQLNEIPGMVELFLCAITVVNESGLDPSQETKNSPEKVDSDSTNIYDAQLKKKREEKDPDRFSKCLEKVANLSFTILDGIAISDITEIMTVRKRMSKPLTYPEVDFAKMKIKRLEAFLNDGRELFARKTSTNSTKTHINADEFCWRLSHFLAKKGGENIVKSQSEMLSPSKDATANARYDCDQFYNEIADRLQMAFVCLRRLHSFPKSCLKTNVKTTEALPSQSKNSKERCDRIEALYDNIITSCVNPRSMDPKESFFWGTGALVEYVYHEALEGKYLCSVDDAIIAKLMREKRKLKQKVVPSSSLALVAKSPSKLTKTQLASTMSTTKEGIILPDVHSSKKSLVEKLKMAGQSAHIEAKLRQYNNEKNVDSRKEEMDRRLREISKTLTHGLHTVKKINKQNGREVVLSRGSTSGSWATPPSTAGLSSRGSSREIDSRVNHVVASHSPLLGARGESRDASRGMTASKFREVDRYVSKMKRIGFITGQGKAESSSPIKYSRGVSPVWSDVPPEIKKVNLLKPFLGGGGGSSAEFLNVVTKGQTRQYGLEVQREQAKRAKAEENRLLKLSESQELSVNKTRAYKLMVAREEIDKRVDLDEKSMHYKSMVETLKSDEMKVQRQRRKAEEKIMKEKNKLELANLHVLRKQEEAKEVKRQLLRKERELVEEIRLRELSSMKEYDEIIRSNKEEARMRVLEERERKREGLRVAAEQAKIDELKEKQDMFTSELVGTTRKLRDGNFWQIRGKVAFYDQVRSKPVPYISYLDEDGNTYYYDQVDGKTSYKKPQDAHILTSDEFEKMVYEQEHGEGTYHDMLADRAFKDKANEEGGYYTEEGLWIEINGYYDENYNFVDTSHGYYDEQGDFHEYDDTMVDLSFMV
jgi:hypothetical protein